MNIIREIQKRLFPKTLNCVYRKDILEYALKHNHDEGLCYCLLCAKNHYGIKGKITQIIPLFHITNAKPFGAIDACFWWPRGKWNNGRMDFLKWLIKQYKDDKTNLKEFY